MTVHAEKVFLTSGEVAGISAGTLGLFAGGRLFTNVDSARHSLYEKPLPIEVSLQRFVGGRYYSGKSNFLDSDFGSAVTPVAGGIALVAVDLGWPGEHTEEISTQDLFLYTGGILANKGINDIFKGLIARPRPYYKIEQEQNKSHTKAYSSFDRASFYSGHTSSAFFAVSFLNHRIRSTLRRELSADTYKNWRWLSPTILYGWASMVGWSRLHAYKHYPSDVIIGALAGSLMAELLWSFGETEKNQTTGENSPRMFKISFYF